MQVLNLFNIDLNAGESFDGLSLLLVDTLVEGRGDSWLGVVSEDSVVAHSLDHEVASLVQTQLVGSHVQLWVLRGFVWVRDSSEVLDLASSGLLVETLDVSAFAHLEGRVDEALVKVDVVFLVDGPSEVSVFPVRGNEGDEADLAGESEELGDF